MWSGECTDICHVAAYEQCVAQRAFFVAQVRCTCSTRVGPTEAFLMNEILSQTQILNWPRGLASVFSGWRIPSKGPANMFLKLFCATQLWGQPHNFGPSPQNPVGVQLFLQLFFFLPRSWLSGAWPITNLVCSRRDSTFSFCTSCKALFLFLRYNL